MSRSLYNSMFSKMCADISVICERILDDLGVVLMADAYRGYDRL